MAPNSEQCLKREWGLWVKVFILSYKALESDKSPLEWTL